VGLNKLVALYDDNGISIDGPVQGWFRDDTAARFRAYGWNVIGPVDGHDVAPWPALGRPGSSRAAHADRLPHHHRPGLAGRAGTAKAHGEPLGADEIAATREALGWPHAPSRCRTTCAAALGCPRSRRRAPAAWCAQLASLPRATRAGRRVRAPHGGRAARDWPRTAAGLDRRTSLPAAATVASRKASQKVLAVLAPRLPELLGGSADLTGST
jgi:transketolase